MSSLSFSALSLWCVLVALLSLCSLASSGPVPAVKGDPQFVGLRGQSFQVHGIDGGIYALVSSARTAINSQFVFLSAGQCPVLGGVVAVNCWSHPGSYMGSLSFLQWVDGQLHTAVVEAGTAALGFSRVLVDGKALTLVDGAVVSFGPSFSLTLHSQHHLVVRTEQFELVVRNSDRFLNIDEIRPLLPLSRLSGTHGLLGQTHSSKTHPSSLKVIEGEVDDYLIKGHHLLSSDFVFNRFGAAPAVSQQGE